MSEQPLSLTVTKAAEVVGVSRASLYELLTDGTIPSFTIGRRRLVSVEALQKYIAAREAASPKPADVPNLRRDAKRAAG